MRSRRSPARPLRRRETLGPSPRHARSSGETRGDVGRRPARDSRGVPGARSRIVSRVPRRAARPVRAAAVPSATRRWLRPPVPRRSEASQTGRGTGLEPRQSSPLPMLLGERDTRRAGSRRRRSGRTGLPPRSFRSEPRIRARSRRSSLEESVFVRFFAKLSARIEGWHDLCVDSRSRTGQAGASAVDYSPSAGSAASPW